MLIPHAGLRQHRRQRRAGPLPKSRPRYPAAVWLTTESTAARGSGDRPGRRHRCGAGRTPARSASRPRWSAASANTSAQADSEAPPAVAGENRAAPAHRGHVMPSPWRSAASSAVFAFIHLRACAQPIAALHPQDRRTAAPRRAAVFVAGCSRCGAQVRQCDKTICGPQEPGRLSLPSLRSSSESVSSPTRCCCASRRDSMLLGCGSAASCSTCARSRIAPAR